MSQQQKGSQELIDLKLDYIKSDVAEIKQTVKDGFEGIKETYVTKESFAPIQKIAYGFVTLILSSVILAILALVIRSK